MKFKGEHFHFWIHPKVKEGSDDFKRIQYAIQRFVRKGNTDLLNLHRTQNLVRFTGINKNLVALNGRNVFNRLLTGDTTYTGEITYGALGDATSPSFASDDTQLNNEVFRKVPADASFEDNVSYIDFFIDSGDTPDGTYTEWGTFIDGTATVNSGRAFSLSAKEIIKSGSIYISSKYTIV